MFAVGNSRMAVCRFCSSLVARAGQDFSLVGKVSEVIPTGSRVGIGAHGKYLGEPFTVIGRVQLEWTSGVWDEWYVSFANERWGWLAEAQGRYYLTFPMPPRGLPPFEHLAPGESIDITGMGLFTVTDLKNARIVTAAGELPDAIEPDETPRTADLEAANGVFATIDYGAEDDGAQPVLFSGRQVTLESLELQGGAPDQDAPAPEGDALGCPNCGAPITRRVPEQTVRLTCGSCNALLDASAGAFQLIEVLKRHKDEPPIPLGTTGTVRGEKVMVVGWIQRGCFVDGVHYRWDELLLYDEKTTGFSWLILNEGHWSLAKPISAADVSMWNGASYKGQTYKSFSSVVGQVERVLGEFYWSVRVRDEARLEDFIAPPEGLSVERTQDEISWTHMVYVERAEVAEAFALPGIASEPRRGIGTLQPWPLESALKGLKRWIIGGMVTSFVLLIVFVMLPDRQVLTHRFTADELTAKDPTVDPNDVPLGVKVHTYLSEPFQLSGRSALEIKVKSDLDNGWAFVEGGVIHEESGEASIFAVETSYYHGYDDGESWSEGNLTGSQDLPAPRGGSCVLRTDIQWDGALRVPPTVTVEVIEGGWSGWQFLFVLMVLACPGLLLLHRRSFEKKRWEESNL
jgi:hypothetical protein